MIYPLRKMRARTGPRRDPQWVSTGRHEEIRRTVENGRRTDRDG